MTFKFVKAAALVSSLLGGALVLSACSDDTAAPASNGSAGAGGSDTGGAAGNEAGGAGGEAGSAGANGGGISLGTEACNSCLGKECGEARAACAADTSCVTCVNEGDDAACHATADTHERADAVLSCQGKACKADCFGATGGDACKGKISGACGTCLEGACCDEVAACFANEHCDACVRTGKESVCHEDAAGHALFHALSKCLSASCGDDCQ